MSDNKHKMFLEVFVSTGELQAMFTLRTIRQVGGFFIESYIKNLSTDFDKASSLAEAYADNLRERIGGPNCEVFYGGTEIDEVFKRRGKLSVRDTQDIESIEAGIVPFGKHRGTKIEDLPDGYILWLTDRLADPELKPAFGVLCSVASGIANDRGLFEKRDAARKARTEEEKKSTWFGEIGARYEENVEVVFKKKVEQEYDGYWFYRYTIKIGDQILFHKGKTELPEGPCRLKFTVKFHTEIGEDKIQKTYINRPAVIEGDK